MLSKSQILSRPPTIQPVDADEIGPGEKIGVKLLSAGEFNKLFKHADSEQTKDDPLYVHLLIACACDDAGAPIFDAGDADAIKGLPFKLVNRISLAAQKLNGIGDDPAKN